jgi:hypothetical protein
VRQVTISLRAYTAEGLLTGSIASRDRLGDLLSAEGSLAVDQAAISPFEGATVRADGRFAVDVDDLMVVVATPDTVTPVHASWHIVELDLGPYHVHAELPSMPGFDPARALARPSGAFVLVGRVLVTVRSATRMPRPLEHAFVWVNRYAVDRVASDIELGFFFPGAASTLVVPVSA